MKIRSILLLGLLWASGWSAYGVDRPNFVVFLVDDLGSEWFGSCGSSGDPTPGLDRLAREGIRFTDFHAQPICTPTRVKI